MDFQQAFQNLWKIIALLIVNNNFHANATNWETKEVIEIDDIITNIKLFHPIAQELQSSVQSADYLLKSSQALFDPKMLAFWNKTPYGIYTNDKYEIKLEQLTPFWGTKIFGSFSQSNGKFAIYDTKLVTGKNGEYTFGFESPLLNGREIDPHRYKLNVSKIYLKESIISQESELLKIIIDAKFAYWDWVQSGKKIEALEELLAYSKIRDLAFKKRVQAGDAASIDQIDNKRTIYTREISLNNAINEFYEKTQKLGYYTRDVEGNMYFPQRKQLPKEIKEIESHIDGLDKNKIIHLTDQWFDNQIISNKIDQVNQDIELAQNNILPNINFKFERMKELGEVKHSFKSQDEYKIGIYIDFPFTLRKFNNIYKSKIEEKIKLENKLILQKNKTFTQINTLKFKLDNIKNNIDISFKEKTLAQLVVKGEQKRFNAGLSNIINVNLREESYINANLNYIQNKILYNQTLGVLLSFIDRK